VIATVRVGGVAFGKRRAWETEVAEERQKSLLAWAGIVRLGPDAWKVGRQAQTEAANDPDRAMMILSDTLQSKAVSTLNQRSSSMNMFARWLRLRRDGPPWPLHEQEAYAYLVDLRESRSPATRAQRFLEAVHFSHFILGLDVQEGLLSSRRLSGAALTSFSRKRMLTQRVELTVEQISKLEAFVCDEAEKVKAQPPRPGNSVPALFVAVATGTLLFALHTRARWGDLYAVSSEPVVEGGYVDAQTSYHKTANRPERRMRWLPLAGLARGLSGRPWARAWLELRAASGLRAQEGLPLLPAPSLAGWSRAKVDAWEATLLLREALTRVGCGGEYLARVGSHSLKASLLAIAAKAG
jgi:hypothetical protein